MEDGGSGSAGREEAVDSLACGDRALWQYRAETSRARPGRELRHWLLPTVLSHLSTDALPSPRFIKAGILSFFLTAPAKVGHENRFGHGGGSEPTHWQIKRAYPFLSIVESTKGNFARIICVAPIDHSPTQPIDHQQRRCDSSPRTEMSLAALSIHRNRAAYHVQF